VSARLVVTAPEVQERAGEAGGQDADGQGLGLVLAVRDGELARLGRFFDRVGTASGHLAVDRGNGDRQERLGAQERLVTRINGEWLTVDWLPAVMLKSLSQYF
jgi:hypothetical protein